MKVEELRDKQLIANTGWAKSEDSVLRRQICDKSKSGSAHQYIFEITLSPCPKTLYLLFKTAY